MAPNFKIKLENWLFDFEDFRKSNLKKIDFNSLPKSGIKVEKKIWKARAEDFSIISKLINNNIKTALDIGSWNGWLANSLTKKGLKVTAIDYFTHELDGMKAKKFYENNDWNSIQMDLEDLSVFNEKFDLIILNRCYPYFTDMKKVIESSLQLLSPKGKLIITGLNINDKKEDTEEFKKAKINFKETYNKDFLFKPFKGFIDEDDISNLKLKGFKILLCPNFKNRTKKLLSSKRNITYYAVYNR